MYTQTLDDQKAELLAWSRGNRSERVAGPIDWSKAVCGFRLRNFDLLRCDKGGRWHGYKLKSTYAACCEQVRTLTEAVYRTTLNRSIA